MKQHDQGKGVARNFVRLERCRILENLSYERGYPLEKKPSFFSYFVNCIIMVISVTFLSVFFFSLIFQIGVFEECDHPLIYLSPWSPELQLKGYSGIL